MAPSEGIGHVHIAISGVFLRGGVRRVREGAALEKPGAAAFENDVRRHPVADARLDLRPAEAATGAGWIYDPCRAETVARILEPEAAQGDEAVQPSRGFRLKANAGGTTFARETGP